QGELLNTLKGHKGEIWSMAMSPDGQTIATGGNDQTIKLWSIGGELIQTLIGHKDWILHLEFSPDNKTLASSSADSTAILWGLELLKFGSLMQQGCEWWREYTESQDTPPDEQQAICSGIAS
ncbi:MAG: hypothetical protein F6K11_28775, partial [Leptolyngbya sp. SIO3F4]|nr:hypothetical protein [Leptolyngbya sp. SIO3F4]